MPTNANAYNSRLTDEALEKRFRDTFRSQGGAELVDDLYASGVIVPVVDFTAAAEGSALRADLQTAWDFSTGYTSVNNASSTIINNAGFWLLDVLWTGELDFPSVQFRARLYLTDGATNKEFWKLESPVSTNNTPNSLAEQRMVVFVRSGDSVVANARDTESTLSVTYRQIADVSGNLINPTGFSFS